MHLKLDPGNVPRSIRSPTFALFASLRLSALSGCMAAEHFQRDLTLLGMIDDRPRIAGSERFARRGGAKSRFARTSRSSGTQR
jgi:hypothetical protein